MSFDEWLKEVFTDEIKPMAPALRIAWIASQKETAQRCVDIIMNGGMNWIDTVEAIRKEFQL